VQQIVRDTGRMMSRSAFAQALDQILPTGQRELCQVVSFRGGKLLVAVDSAPLCAELSSFRREELRLRINEILPQRQVAQLHFRLGGTAHV
jgi:hypothetical protein